LKQSDQNVAIWLVIALVLMTVFNQFSARQQQNTSVEYSQFIEEVKQGNIAKVTIEGRVLKGVKSNGAKFTTYLRPIPGWFSDLLKAGVIIEAKPEEEPSLLMNIFVSWFPMLLLIGVWIFFMRQMQGGRARRRILIRQSRARMLDEIHQSGHLCGCRRLRGSQGGSIRAGRLPARPQQIPEARRTHPRGVLDGRISRYRQDVAGARHCREAKVPFFSISGSDFVESSSASVLPECATCLNRQRSTPRALCLSMKSMPWAASEAPAWAAETTNANRP